MSRRTKGPTSHMKVTQIRSFPVRDDDGRLYFIVRVDTDAGIYGLGEVGVARLGRSIAIAIDHLCRNRHRLRPVGN